MGEEDWRTRELGKRVSEVGNEWRGSRVVGEGCGVK
jgi:hypothetical protein